MTETLVYGAGAALESAFHRLQQASEKCVTGSLRFDAGQVLGNRAKCTGEASIHYRKC